ncbi:GNAT family N-acetyltransferase (plasmid) [Alcanivorax sp. N3-2A]|nr:GNAT family N-acetyltransferase [Alcanivorax sp. N3-2A]ASK36965.1 GNAT family N-acetyltransferase [Alcanivorax sp. N3-2A]
MQYPFLSTAFLDTLEETGAVDPRRGWAPCHLGGGDHFLPLYQRADSRGEYVFDFAWADAYQRHGLPYYPKLVTAIPFTPVAGPRWRGDWSASALWEGVQERTREHGASGWHLLFPDQHAREVLAELPLIGRQACHFRWFNRDYADFEDFLGAFNSRKRKSVRRERRRIGEQGLSATRHSGARIEAHHWRFFYHCYANTYRVRGQRPYLSERFFLRLAETLGEQLLMVIAWHQGEPVAAGLYLFDDHTLYGRYWGCVREYDALHFEVCYYQGIEFAIERGLREFDPGVQGEHKILRGFEPVITHSLHWLAEPAFYDAVADFCQREARHVISYRDEARTLLPYRREE